VHESEGCQGAVISMRSNPAADSLMKGWVLGVRDLQDERECDGYGGKGCELRGDGAHDDSIDPVECVRPGEGLKQGPQGRHGLAHSWPSRATPSWPLAPLALRQNFTGVRGLVGKEGDKES
jgi:hypothetical protein